LYLPIFLPCHFDEDRRRLNRIVKDSRRSHRQPNSSFDLLLDYRSLSIQHTHTFLLAGSRSPPNRNPLSKSTAPALSANLWTCDYGRNTNTFSRQQAHIIADSRRPGMKDDDGHKWACDSCIRGHRVSGCKHTGKKPPPSPIAYLRYDALRLELTVFNVDRELRLIAPKGRPVKQCEHCRGARKSKSHHAKCDCGDKKEQPEKGTQIRLRYDRS